MTAAAFARAFVRACHPDQASPAIAFTSNVQGCTAFNEKKGALTGVKASGQKLTVKLVNADPTFISQASMPFFAAVKPNMPINPKGENKYPSAGPYTIESRDPAKSLSLIRNRFYKGARPANPDRIVITVNTDQNQSLLQVRRGEVDHDLGGVPATANEPLSKEFGINKGRYFVNPLVGTQYVALNTARPAFRTSAARRGANFAIDRPAMLRVLGSFAGVRTDQILAPALPGFRDAKLYPIKGADPARAKQVAGNPSGEVSLLHTTSAAAVNQAQIFKFNLEQMGYKVTLKPQPFAVAIKTMGTKGNDIDAYIGGWIADYFDPYDFINVLLDGDEHPGREQQQLLVLEQRDVQQADEGCREADWPGALQGVRPARHRHHVEGSSVGPDPELQLAGLHRAERDQLHLPPGLRSPDHQRTGKDLGTKTDR